MGVEQTQGSMILLISLVTFFRGISGAGWDYYGPTGPEYWSKDYPNCEGRSQSPVNFNFEEIIYRDYGSFMMNGYNHDHIGMTLFNNGHTSQININGSVQLSSGGLGGEKYHLEQIHFHWGKVNTQGSEHTVNDKAYSAEMHFVHYDDHHDEIGHAVDQDEGLAVLGVFIEVGQYDHPGFAKIIDHFSKIQFAGQATIIPSFHLDSLFPKDLMTFFRYHGGLTTPPCHQSVIWTVFQESVSISQKQMDAFRGLHEHDSASGDAEKIGDNFRPIQPLFDRVVFMSPKPMTQTASNLGSSFTLLCTIAAFLLYFR